MGKNFKWTKRDTERLRTAINDFNKKVSKVQTEENKLYLPELKSYKEIKSNVATRQELNKQIESLRRFQNKTATALFITEAGEKMTRWEQKELDRMRNIAIERISEEFKLVKEKLKDDENKMQWRALEDQKETLEGTIKHMNELGRMKGKEFEHEKEIIKNQGSLDYDIRKAMNFRELFYKEVLPSFRNFKNYKTLKKTLDSIKDPIQFAEVVASADKLGDINLWYPKEQAIDGTSDEEQFNSQVEKIQSEAEKLVG